MYVGLFFGRDMTNRIKFTQEKKALFIKELCKDAIVTRSCKICGVEPQTVYGHRHSDPDFAKAWDEAVRIGSDTLVEEAQRRAMGYYTPMYDKDGNPSGERFSSSDILMMFLLKGRRPEYRDKVNLDLPADARFTLTINTGGDDGKK